jgi:receptor protein-tyrosine kinase
MSLIEKAAKRLEQLKRAGAIVSNGESAHAPAEGNGAQASDRVPTPEAIVRKLATKDTGPAVPIESRDHQFQEVQPLSRAGDVNTGKPLRSVQLDFTTLEKHSLITPDNPESPVTQEFRTIKRTILRNATGHSGLKVRNGNLVMVTSSVPGEGKTYVATNLAMSIAMEVDHTVMLVDGDVANASLPGILGTPSSPGLLDLLVRDDLDISDVLLQTNIQGLTVLPAGTRDQRATELLASEKMGQLLFKIANRYPERIIIFDSPPLLATTEAPVLAARMGQVIFAVAANSTTRNLVKQALALVEQCEVVLMLLNKTAKAALGPYYGYYGDADPQ